MSSFNKIVASVLIVAAVATVPVHAHKTSGVGGVLKTAGDVIVGGAVAGWKGAKAHPYITTGIVAATVGVAAGVTGLVYLVKKSLAKKTLRSRLPRA